MSDKPKSLFKITLRAARVNKGLSQEEAAQIANKNVDTIRKYEADSSHIPRDLLMTLLELYEVPDEHVFFGKESVKTGFGRAVYQELTS